MKTTALILGIIFFLIFSYDIENDRDEISWTWLLNSILVFILMIMQFIREEIQKLKDKE